MNLKEDILDKSIQAVKIAFTATEKNRFKEEAREIDAWLEPLLQISTKNVEPSNHAVKVNNIFREDRPQKTGDIDKLTRNSKVFEDGYYQVPSIINE